MNHTVAVHYAKKNAPGFYYLAIENKHQQSKQNYRSGKKMSSCSKYCCWFCLPCLETQQPRGWLGLEMIILTVWGCGCLKYYLAEDTGEKSCFTCIWLQYVYFNKLFWNFIKQISNKVSKFKLSVRKIGHHSISLFTHVMFRVKLLTSRKIMLLRKVLSCIEKNVKFLTWTLEIAVLFKKSKHHQPPLYIQSRNCLKNPEEIKPWNLTLRTSKKWTRVSI